MICLHNQPEISVEILKLSLKNLMCILNYTYYLLGRMVMQVLLFIHLIKQQGKKAIYSALLPLKEFLAMAYLALAKV